jgi:PAS domain S-box-containing protein
MDTLISILGRNGFLPHGYCFSWSPGLLWSMVGADAVIAMAYFSIPIAMLSYVRRRPEATMNRLAWLFSAFIFACGVTHVMDIWTVWRPDYAWQAATKVVTAGLSMVTAIALWPLIPRALRIPSVQQLQSAIAELRTEVQRRRGAEEQLAAMQQGLAATLASIDAGFIATDRTGKVTHMNAVAETVTGWSQRDSLGEDLWTVFVSEGSQDAHLSSNPVDVMLEQGLSVETLHRVVSLSRTGIRTPLEVRTTLTRNDDGQVTGLAMVFRDMSRIDKAEAESKRLAAIVESSTDAIIGQTLDGQITTWNGAAQVMYGYSAQEAIGQPIQMLIPLHLQAEEVQMLAALALGKPVPAFDTVRLTRAGESLDVSITISPIRDTEGRLVGASKIVRNISMQRRAAAALRDTDSLLRTIHMHFIVSITDRAGLITDVNESFCEISGYAREELLGQSHRIINSGVQLPTFWVDLWRTISAGRPWRGEICNRAKDGSLYWVDSVIAPFAGADGRIEKYISIRRDITAAKRAEGARLEALRLEAENRQIREASRLKSQFLANMSHELRTPLNAVIGFADLLRSGYIQPDSPKHHEFLGHIGTSGRHLLQLINDVLDLSKVESGKFEFFPVHVDLPALLKEVQEVLLTAINEKNIHVTVDIDAKLVDLTLDAARLKQVLYNYLSNAIKFTAPGGNVAVRAMTEGPEHFRVEVEDTGIGISAADMSRLFTEFQQLDSGYGKQHQGTGLGLALTRRLVQAQGGQVGVRSTLGVGSVFFVVLNRTHGLDMQRAEAVALGTQDSETNRVLVIEDDQQDRSLLVDVLTQAGFEVDAAGDGTYALRRARETAYAALTLDLGLPDQPGLELLGHIRGQGASHAAPVVGMTMPADPARSATFAIANILSKPIRSDEITSAMGRFKLQGAGRATVMVIDDEQLSLDLMSSTLTSIGIDAICFQDGRMALQEIDRHQPVALVLDLMMPEFDGFQVLDALQRMPTWKDLPVFIWTSMLLTDEEYAILARSARAILIKGGGALEGVLESLRRWRLPVVPGTEVKP